MIFCIPSLGIPPQLPIMVFIFVLIIAITVAIIVDSKKVHLSNIALPLDTKGRTLLTGEADVLALENGTYLLYMNTFGTCAGRDCCSSTRGCQSCCFRTTHDTDCTDTPNNATIAPSNRHFISVYSTTDFESWQAHGSVFNPVIPDGVMYRPHVLYNKVTRKFVMWYKVHNLYNRSVGGQYGVAVSDSFAGPFMVEEAAMYLQYGGDHTLFQDDDGRAFLVYHASIQLLNSEFTGFEEGQHNSKNLPDPRRWEGTVMFKRSSGGVSRYYILGGHYCCACKGGSNAYVFMAEGSPLATYSFVGDIGVNTSTSSDDEHSPYRWITRAQTSSAFAVPTPSNQSACSIQSDSNESQIIILGNQWVTAPASARFARNQDLLYWALLEFDENTGIPRAIQHQDQTMINISPSC